MILHYIIENHYDLYHIHFIFDNKFYTNVFNNTTTMTSDKTQIIFKINDYFIETVLIKMEEVIYYINKNIGKYSHIDIIPMVRHGFYFYNIYFNIKNNFKLKVI